MKSSEPVKETVQTTQSPTPVEKETVVTTQAEVFPPPVAMLQVSVEVGLFFFFLNVFFYISVFNHVFTLSNRNENLHIRINVCR